MSNSTYNIVASMNGATVASEYEPEIKSDQGYQSEAELEADFIKQLTRQGYEYLEIHKEADLIDNLRDKLEKLNDYKFSDNEWKSFFGSVLANPAEGIVEKTRKIQEGGSIQLLIRDNGEPKNIKLIDKKNIHRNHVQVINQYVEDKGKHDTRYDVTILVNGLPLVHVELKRRGVAIKEAFNQINRYQRDSFWAGSGLFEFVQVFVISNGTHTKYYSNTTRDSHIKEMKAGRNKTKKTSNSFEFTSYWADANNRIISDLVDFTKTFFTKHVLLNILTKYCVFTTEELLLVMRPYQIAATERILNRIEIATNYKKAGTIEGGGYIWHTTGSGKTLTSFKTAQLATDIEGINKVIFVVDRKDLDYQTMKEYDRFEKGAANSNKSTAVLQKQLEDPTKKIIITTIQKLDVFVSKNNKHDVYGQHIVIIFDECHRSQFGKMHAAIVKAFRNYHLFGFTGTPIFAVNARKGGDPTLKTTEQLFGERLHTYTIVDAINDGNVLPFKIDYIKTIKMKEDVKDKEVPAIDRQRALEDPKRVKEIVAYMLEHYDQKTKRDAKTYSFKQLQNIAEVAKAKKEVEEIKAAARITGFNSILATSSIPMAQKYYNELKEQIKEQGRDLKIATIFSYNPNADDFDEESFDTEGLDQNARDFLDSAIMDYNLMFHTNYDTSGDKFQNYYKDVSLRMKNKELDILVVVDMFLTGFDATTLNTLWVDKNLRMHGLIQAFSRTNRILNSIKTFGNIVCFRDLQEETDEAIALFGDKDASSVVLLKDFDSYYNGYDDEKGHRKGYTEMVEELNDRFPLGQQITGEQNQKDFIMLFGSLLRLRNILTAFDEFEGKDLLTERQMQDYQSVYIDLYNIIKPKEEEPENINEDIVFEMELIRHIEVNIDYILMLVAKYHEGNCEDKEIVGDISRAIQSSLQLRSKKELIENFITYAKAGDIYKQWHEYVEKQKEAELESIITEEKLKPEETRVFISNAMRDGSLKTTGTEIDQIMPPMPRFGGGNRVEKKQGIIAKLIAFFEKYFGI
ncbi:MAG: type I restriction endonuclease subunit R [Clostridia bacterium]|nr:type I restriction endonuclease subunit R [Clostridia bacterium]